MDRAADYRKRADECRQKAEAATNQHDKEAWLKLADEWLMLAKNAEDPSA
jgi:hypothetical protein